MKKITFVYPAIGKKPGTPYIKTWKMEPLPIAVLAALTPPDIEIEFFDDRLELIDYDSRTDLVAITVETYTARRAYGIAGKFRERGIPVILGGYHPTHLPEEAAAHADAVVVGNAEGIWRDLLADAKAG
nr:radical SAM protein [Calditrichia bacterium]